MAHDIPTVSRKVQFAISIFVVFHIAAVLAEPFRFFSQSPVKPASEEADWLRRSLAPYVDFMFLSHGYAFFAPNPGPSHLLECEIKLAKVDAKDNTMTKRNARIGTLRDHPLIAPIEEEISDSTNKWRVYPDRNADLPRLLYHRYFMLSEFYQTIFAPKTLTQMEQETPGLKERWQVDRAQYEALQSSIEKHFRTLFNVDSIRLRRIEHALPSQVQVFIDGWKLTDPRLYLELSEGEALP